MNFNNKHNGGFIGLLVLLICVTIIIFYIARTDLFTGQKGGKNIIQQGQDAISQAENAKKIIEQDSNRALGQ